MKNTSEPSVQKFLLSLPTALMGKVRQEAPKNYRTLSGQVSYMLEQYYALTQPSEHETTDHPEAA